MIVVKVELWSAIDGRHTELARMMIANDGETSRENQRVGDYEGFTYKGRDAGTLHSAMTNQLLHGGKANITRTGKVKGHRRLDLHVWHLVGKMLKSMGYGE